MNATSLHSDAFQNALLNIERRAERQLKDELLVRCFVPNRVVNELDIWANQLLFGRRGVGKTHSLKVLLSHMTQRGALCHYIDCTSFGSGLGSDGSAKNVAIRFFAQFVRTITDKLFENATRSETPENGLDNRMLDVLIKISNVGAPQEGGSTFDFVKIHTFFNEFLDLIGAERLVIFLDEWAQIPRFAQPYFAEFIKRGFLSNPRVTLKIAVVDFTYDLSAQIGGQDIGLEKSADIFTDIHMDKFFVWDQDPAFVEQFFAEVIYNHLALELGLEPDASSASKKSFILKTLFTQAPIFSELCRASEGNCRDLLILLGKAYKSLKRAGNRDRIGIEDVKQAASELYKGDKYTHIASEITLEQFLSYLINSVIRQKRSRTFMVPYDCRLHPLLVRYYNARLLHLLDVEWSHPDKPGERYSLVTMDYGTYVTFKGTANEPEQLVFWDRRVEQPDSLDLVPLDDRRSIRRIVVEKAVLDEFWSKLLEERRQAAETSGEVGGTDQ